MMKVTESVGIIIRDALAKIDPPAGTGRPSTKAIYETLKTLKSVRSTLSQQFGGPVKIRYAGCPPVIKQGKKARKVLGYLWDFSFSRFAIPDAIGQGGGALPQAGKYEILLVVESELGDADEICRDLLKLLDARAAIRCLIYRQPRRPQHSQRLHSRMVRVLHSHAHFDAEVDQWLFVGLSWSPGTLDANVYTLTADGSGFRALGT